MSHRTLFRLASATILASVMGAPTALGAAPRSEDTAVSSAPEAAQLTEGKKKKESGDDQVKEGWHLDGFGLRNGKSKIELVGYAQWDFRDFNWKVQGDETGEGQAATREFRRFRFGIQGEFDKFTFEFAADPREAEEGSKLKDLTVGYEFGKRANLLVGHFKPPVSQEFLTSASKTDFVQRPMLTGLSPDRDWGVALSGELGRFDYSIGGFAGDGDGNVERADASLSAAGRLGFRLRKNWTLFGSAMRSEVEPDPRVGTAEPSPKGASGKSPGEFTFWNRPHVKGVRTRLGVDTEFTKGPFRARAEFLQMNEQRLGQGSTGQNIPDVRGRGWMVGASYVITGEKKESTVEVEKSVFKGGRGALELVARAEGLKFDDTGDPSGFAGYGNRARNIAPSGGESMEVGLNYWPSNFLKFQGSASWEKYNDPLIAPQPGKTGRYRTLQARIQVMLP